MARLLEKLKWGRKDVVALAALDEHDQPHVIGSLQDAIKFVLNYEDSSTGLPVNQKGINGASLVADGGLATKITVSGSITYIGEAAAGTAQATAAWRAQKIDETTGTVITWADGNTNFDNVATDLTALTYS